jgi:phytoene synthase
MRDGFGHCEALVREADKDRFLATLFAPAKYRRALFALYAFNVEIARVREVVRQPMAGEIRLQWWRDAFAGAGHGEVRAHPVAAALLDTIVRYRLPPRAFIDLIEARAFDLYDDPMATLAELEGYAAKTASALIALAAQILSDGSDAGLHDLARHAGIGQVIAGLLLALPVHAARRQLYVPLDVLARHGASPDDVFARKATPEFKAALADLRLHARRHLDEAKIAAAQMPAAVAPALLPAALARPTLARMERRRNPFKPRPLPQWRRQWIIWRAARAGVATAL